MKKKWEIGSCDENLVKKIADENNISELIATILFNRGITEKDDVKVFLEPTRSDFYDPFLMPDMEKAVERIIKAINKNENVMIYGDYDVDGITSITVLSKFLRERNLSNIKYYVPNRLNEGYGLNTKAIKKINNDKCSLIITVDCGITGMEEIEYAKSLGIDVIVTDHHEPLEEIPKAIAVIDCKRKDNQYPFKELAGVGVVFKLIQGLAQKLELDEKEYLKFLDLVSIGTISDIVPLIDENRVISKLGLKLIPKTKNIGLKALLSENINSNSIINATAVSFVLAPRINACGRIGFEDEAVELFMTENISKANELTRKLNEYNRQRQLIEKKIYDEALEIIEGENLQENNTIVIGKEGWHHGVIGIVSSKITEKYYKPTILVGFEENIGKGSGRSITGFDLHEALCDVNNLLEKFGGHSMAVGITINKNNFGKFVELLEIKAKKMHTEELAPIIFVDKEITLKQLTLSFAEELKELEPYGANNKVPVFLIKNLKIDSIRSLSEGKHLKLTLLDSANSNILNALGFNMGSLTEEYKMGEKVDVIGNIETNEFNGNKDVQLIIKDIRRSY